MESQCVRGSLADDVVVEAVRPATVRPAGGDGFSTHGHVAIIPPVVLALAAVCSASGAAWGPRTGQPGSCPRRFWAVLSPFGDTVDTVRVVAALRGAHRAGTEPPVSDHRLNDVLGQSHHWCDRDRLSEEGRSGRSPTGRCHSATLVSGSSLSGVLISLDHAVDWA